MQEGPVQLLPQTQVKPAGFSTQVAPFIHGDDKHACSTDEGDTECGRDDGDARGWRWRGSGTSGRRGSELTDVAVAPSEAVLTLALVLVWLGVGAGATVLAGLVVATVIQICRYQGGGK